jgi:hypothetical protein
MILFTSSLCCSLPGGMGLLPDCRQGIYTMININCRRWFSIK